MPVIAPSRSLTMKKAAQKTGRHSKQKVTSGPGKTGVNRVNVNVAFDSACLVSIPADRFSVVPPLLSRQRELEAQRDV